MPTFPVLTRKEWGAVDPKYQESLNPPIEMVIFHCTGKKECLDNKSCIQAVQKIQKKHLRYGLPDILYNFLIGGDGTIYEGRGWDTAASNYAHTHFDGKILDVAYIGPYKIPSKMPPPKMLNTAVNLMNWGRVKNVLIEECLRSDLDLQEDHDMEYGGIKSDDEDTDSDMDSDLMSENDVEDLHVNVKEPPTAKDIFGTQDESEYSDHDDDSDSELDEDADVNDAEVFDPNKDDVPFTM